MTATPALPCTVRLADGTAIACEAALRVLPGRRWVLAGTRAGRPVIVKLFLAGAPTARRDFDRECAGLAALARAALPGPALVHAGAAAAPAGWCIVTARLPGRALGDALGEPAALSCWVDALAALHRAGLTQTDPHLGNFLWDGARVALLDPGGMRRAPWLRTRVAALRALARALAELPLSREGAIPHLAARYAAGRGWPAWPAQRLDAALGRARALRSGRYARKSLRACREFAVERSWRHRAVIDRGADSPALRALLTDPDAVFGPDARWLKAGRSAQLVRVALPDGEVVVKRYVARDIGRWLRRAVRPSRAARAWLAARRLRLFGVPVARPLALLERRCGPLHGRAYLVTEYVAGVPFTQCIHAEGTFDAVAGLLRAFTTLRVSHGDLKASNVLITPAGTALAVDLDGARAHRSRAGLRRAGARDRARALANLEHQPAAQAALARALEETN